MTSTAQLAAKEPASRSMHPDDAAAYETSAQVLELMERHNTPPYPETYAFWYAYVTRKSETLVKTVDKLIDTQSEITRFDIRDACETHLEAESQANINDRIGLAFEEQMDGVSALIRSGLSDNDQFQERLSQIGSGLPQASTNEGFRDLVSQLVEENERMAQRGQELTEGLKSSQDQIATLNSELEVARQQSTRDPLTGVANRRAMTARLDQEIAAHLESNTSLCLVMGDIDHFKRVNDTFGHVVGDEVLKIFAEVLRTNVKGRDFIARFGGEEFVVILPQTSSDLAFKLVDSIRDQFSKKRLFLRQSREQIGQVTASFGIAELAAGASADDIMELADQRLYQAKNAGRDRVCAG